MCGSLLVNTCPNCAFANPLSFRFCGNCGSVLPTDHPISVQPQLPGFAAAPSPLPATVVEPAQAIETPVLADIQLEGERRLVTVILADVTSSTNLLEQIGTETWVEIMNRILHMLESEIYRFGGKVDQFRGDGLVAFFGASGAQEDDPERAVLAGLSMLQAVKPYSEELKQKEDIDLRLRVGINTGEVIVASVGDRRQHQEDTAMGMGVAIAARMETAAEPGTVLVSENTYHLIQNQFDWQPMGEITVKGISQPIAVYRPITPKAYVDRIHALESFGSSVPMIGRDLEFKQLTRSLEDLYDGRGCIVLLSGEAGLGKTFLVTELRRYNARRSALIEEAQRKEDAKPIQLTFVIGRCRSYERSRPYSFWNDVFRDWLGTRSEDPDELARDRLRACCEELWGERVDEYYPYLATLLSMPLEDKFVGKVRHLDAEGLRQQFYRATRSWLVEATRKTPLVLIVTEMQWADTSSLELLKYCLPMADSEALLLLLVFRPERTSPMWEFRHFVETNYPHRMTKIELSPLTAQESTSLIQSVIGEQALPGEIIEHIIKNSEGNPYYILELIHSLIDAQLLVQESETGKWRLVSAQVSIDLPDSLQRLLLARIDRLSSDERRILQLAAVVGNTFWYNVLETLVEGAEILKDQLTAMQRAQLIVERVRVPELGMEYSFRSSLIRDAAYESLLSSQRKSVHLKVAEYFEEFVGLERRKQYEGLIAYHYGRSGNTNKELFYTLRAAEQARQVYANAEAISHFNRAIELLDKMEAKAKKAGQRYAILSQRFEVLNARSLLYYRSGDFEAAYADAQALLPLAEQMSDDPSWMIDALLRQPQVFYLDRREDIKEGLQMSSKALELAQQLGDKAREMNSLTSLGRLYSLLRDTRWREMGERALALSRELGDKRAEANLLLGIGSAYGSDDLERSTEYLEAVLPILQQLEDRRTELHVLGALGAQAERQGDYYKLLTEFEEERLKISREIGDRLSEGSVLMYCGQIRSLYLGDYEEGLNQVLEGLRIFERLNTRIYPLLRTIQIQVNLGRLDEARQNLELARPIGEQEVIDIGRAGLGLVTAIYHNALGEETHYHLAQESAMNVVRLVNEQRVSRQYLIAAMCEICASQLGLARLISDTAARQEHTRKALDASQASLEVYRQFGFVQIIECLSEEVLFRHSQTLEANQSLYDAMDFLKLAHQEMMRKYALIPEDSHYRRTYLENIALHREIQVEYLARVVNIP
jgi:predicted ATPase/class 3 adenylate cyclase